MITTRSEPSSRTMVRATRVLPDPEPPAMPMRIRRGIRRTVTHGAGSGNRVAIGGRSATPARNHHQHRLVAGRGPVARPRRELGVPAPVEAVAVRRPESFAPGG